MSSITAIPHHLHNPPKCLLPLLLPAIECNFRKTDWDLVVAGDELLHGLYAANSIESVNNIPIARKSKFPGKIGVSLEFRRKKTKGLAYLICELVHRNPLRSVFGHVGLVVSVMKFGYKNSISEFVGRVKGK